MTIAVIADAMIVVDALAVVTVGIMITVARSMAAVEPVIVTIVTIVTRIDMGGRSTGGMVFIVINRGYRSSAVGGWVMRRPCTKRSRGRYSEAAN